MDTQTNEKTLNIHQRLLAVMADVAYIQKTGTAPEMLGRFRYAKHDDVVGAVRPHLIKHGVYAYPETIHQMTEVMVVPDKNGNEKRVFHCIVHVVMHFVNVDNPDERVTVGPMIGEGMDQQDKAPGKAMSYAIKYGFLKGLNLETGDDPEADAVVDRKPKREESGTSRSISYADVAENPEVQALFAEYRTPPAKREALLRQGCNEKMGLDQFLAFLRKVHTANGTNSNGHAPQPAGAVSNAAKRRYSF
ncbi:MAG: hypothetical protein AMXMBFR84_26390 [Candidatus Hydrogenedentota bacterium]